MTNTDELFEHLLSIKDQMITVKDLCEEKSYPNEVIDSSAKILEEIKSFYECIKLLEIQKGYTTQVQPPYSNNN